MKKLYRSDKDKVLAGLLGGLGEYSNIDPVVLRVVFIVLLILTGLFPFVIIYVVALFIVPQRPTSMRGDVIDTNA